MPELWNKTPKSLFSLLRPHRHSLSSLCRPPDWVEYESSPQVNMFLPLNIQSPVLVRLLFSETSPTTGFTGWDHCPGARWPALCTRQPEEHPCLSDHSSSPGCAQDTPVQEEEEWSQLPKDSLPVKPAVWETFHQTEELRLGLGSTMLSTKQWRWSPVKTS